MDVKVISEAGVPNRHKTVGLTCVRHRSLLHVTSRSGRAIAQTAAANGTLRNTDHTSGVLWLYALTVGDARHRAPSRRGESETELRRYSGMRLSR